MYVHKKMIKTQKIDEELYRRIYENGKSKCDSTVANLPTQIALEITRNCNLSCEYCPRTSNPLLKDTLNITIPIVKDLNNVWAGAESVVFCGGGEPFLHPGVYEIARLIREQNNDLSLAITTNGTLKFSHENIKRMNELNINLVFSLDTMERYTLRSGSNTTNVIDNIKNVAKIKKQNNYEYPRLVIVSMLTNDCIDTIPDVLRFAIECDVVSFHVEKINPIWNDLCEKQRIDLYNPERVDQLFGELFEISKDSDITIEGKLSYEYGSNSEIIEKLKYGPCLDPWLFAVISASGMLAPCPNYIYPYRHGIIRGGRSMQDIRNQLFGGSHKYDDIIMLGDMNDLWNSSEIQNLRKHHMDNTPYYNCQNCKNIFEHNSWFKCT